MSVHSSSKPSKEHLLKNEQFDEALDVSQSMDVTHTPKKFDEHKADGSAADGSAAADNTAAAAGANTSETSPNKSKFSDKPFDEAVSMSDSMSDSSVDTNASPKHGSSGAARKKEEHQMSPGELRKHQDHALSANPTQGGSQKPTVGHLSPPVTSNANIEESRDDDSDTDDTSASSGDDDNDNNSDDDGDEDGNAGANGGGTLNIEGAYNPSDYDNLDVGPDVREIFDYISRYKPHEVELDTSLKCFIPDYIPAVGEMDAFIKVPVVDRLPMGLGGDANFAPAVMSDPLGLKVLDEPAANQSDSTVLELQLRAISKKSSGEVAVRSIENASRNPMEIQKWITSINELHRSKPPPSVHYKKAMPDIEVLMDVWPEEFEDALVREKIPLPNVNLECSNAEFIKIWCSILDVPVYDGNIVESLHVLFTTYMEFTANQHFMPNQAAGKDGGNGNGQMDDDFGSFLDYK
jgi:intraflagellar transport protein 46